MVVSSYFYAGNIEREHLIKDAEDILNFTEAEIISNLLEPEAVLSGYSETIRSMLLNKEDKNTIFSYMTYITQYLIKDNDSLALLSDIHGYFHIWGGSYLSSRDWTPPAEYLPLEQPWYKAAVAAKGKIVMSDPYKDILTSNTILTFSRYLMDENDSPLGVICLDIELDRIRYAININLTQNSYGMLLDKNLKIIEHIEPDLIGQYLYEVNSSIAALAYELEQGLNVYERRVENYMHEECIVYFNNIKYGWYLGIVIPIGEYYKSVNNMAIFLILLGSLLAAALCVMMYKISMAKKKSDLRTQQKSNFLATISHEIRTPLNAILGITEIQMQNKTHPPSTSEAFIKINNSGNLLLSIINDILDLSKIEAGKLNLVPVKYEVASLINDIVQLNYIRYESKPIEFKLDIDENIPSFLVGDELRIKQILNNLLSNAFKYTDQGEVVLSANSECVGRGGAVLVTLVFQVSDTGQGMTQEQIGKLFNEYTRFNLEANRTTEGAGLGMTITQNLVNLMYGKIIVKSTVGEGTSVTVRIPQKTDGIGISGIIGREVSENLQQFQLGNVIQIKKNQIRYEPMPYGSVLVVDDVETNLYVAKGLMSPYGLQIDLAMSGFEAIKKIRDGAVYDIVFMDHMMPKMDGIETTKQLRSMGYTRPIVALTANALAGHAEMFLKNNFDDFISKPIDIRQLNIVLNKLIRDKQPAEVVEAAHRERNDQIKKYGISGQRQVDSQLAAIFARDADKAAAVLEKVMKNSLNTESDMHLFVINVHAMKSALANIGEQELSSIALRMEQAGREKDINVIMSEINGFLSKLKEVIEKNKPKDEEGTSEDTEESLAFLNEKLLVIQEACIAYNKKAAKTVINELREKTWSINTKKLIELISEHLLHSEFDDAAALVGDYIKNKG
jgi:signal transduction histidine kinase/DNA-binding response OmpR family regulator